MHLIHNSSNIEQSLFYINFEEEVQVLIFFCNSNENYIHKLTLYFNLSHIFIKLD